MIAMLALSSYRGKNSLTKWGYLSKNKSCALFQGEQDTHMSQYYISGIRPDIAADSESHPKSIRDGLKKTLPLTISLLTRAEF